ncbi:hypothetical protein [Streptomyces sp. AcE210]|uniref:hypothetical protein n=1 Tax=Streptomyces sp. AcE210 TaxID=2292703 RepID=UPI000E30299D|nr:hypothetical protein [Streptomyces sp. AcE210]RFC70521.1 hypothetical protein DXZ75_24600 [Streptomyces sp. AcE210]
MADTTVTGVQAPECARERVVIPSPVRAARHGELDAIAWTGTSALACRPEGDVEEACMADDV